LAPKTLKLFVVPGKAATPSIRINRVPTNKLFLARILKVLPARHPGYCRVGNIVRAAGLSQKLRQVSVCGCSIKMVAKVSPQLPAGVGNSGRPVSRLGVE